MDGVPGVTATWVAGAAGAWLAGVCAERQVMPHETTRKPDQFIHS